MVVGVVVGQMLRTGTCGTTNVVVMVLSEMAKLWEMEKDVAKATSAQMFVVYW